MEELQTTEVLDREILEDARRKAFRILKTADDTVKTTTTTWEKKTGQAVDDLKKRFEERRGRVSDEIMARLPLDKRRAESEKIEALVQNALDAWYAAQGRDRVLALLAANPQAVKPALTYSGMSESEVQDVIKNVAAKSKLTNASWDVSQWELRKDESPGVSKLPALVLNMPSVRIAASAETAAQGLLEGKRAELAAGLLGEGVLND